MKHRVVAEAEPGETIDHAAVDAIRVAETACAYVVLTHNDTEVIVDPGDTANDVISAWEHLRIQAQRRAKL